MPAIVTFDGAERVVTEISTGQDNELDIVEIYSEWKEWVKASSANAGIEQAFRQVGGDPISPSQDLGTTFFLLNGWRIRPAEFNHKLTIVGNVYTDPAGDSVFIPTIGAYTVNTETRVSNLVDAAVARLDLAQLQESIYIDVDDGVAGTAVGIGTPTNPVNNIADAFTIATRDNLHSFSVLGDIVLDRSIASWKLIGTVSDEVASFDFNGFMAENCSFSNLTLTGDAAGSRLNAKECTLVNLTDATGLFKECEVQELFVVAAIGKLTLVSCRSGSTTAILDLADNVDHDCFLHRWSGSLEIRNVDVPTQQVVVEMSSGKVIIHTTCDDGSITVRGVGEIEDNSTGSTVVSEALVSPLANVRAILNAELAAYGGDGSTADTLKLIQAILALSA